jgi:hypothetical protein
MTPHLPSLLHPLPLRRLIALLVATVALLLPRAGAYAAAGPGTFVIKTTSVDEKNGEWHIKVRIDLPRAPGMMHTPMRFTFSKEVVDERAIMSQGAEPQHHRMVLDSPTKQIVSLDVDFADASGKVFKSTYFEFDLQRASGYFEAGEYLVSLSGPDGEVGGAQRLTLKGDNPPVFRGAMVFSEGKGGKKGPKMENVNNDVDGGPQGAGDTPAAAPVSTDVAAVGSAPNMVPSNAYNKTAEEEAVQGHPEGCGCLTVGFGRGDLAGVVGALFGLWIVAARRRRISRSN